MRLPDSWRAFDGVFGGYVMGLVVEAAASAVPYQPLAMHVQFTGSVQPGTADFACTVQHRGRRTASVGVVVTQGHPRLTATVKLASSVSARLWEERVDLSGHAAPAQGLAQPVHVGRWPYGRYLDLRGIGTGDRIARQTAWIRFDESAGAVPELGVAGVLVVLLDSLWPGVFALDPAPVFVPTLDFMVHYAPGAPVSRGDWLYAQQSTPWATDEFCVDDTQLFSADGRVVAQARQTRRLRWS